MLRRELSLTSSQPHWLTLSEAAELLGVHASTVRRWSDKGELRCIRTPGGHRRFLTEDLHAFLNSREQHAIVTAPDALTEELVRHTRHEMKTENIAEEPWRTAFDESERTAHRQSGRRLVGLAIRYTSRTTERDVALQEGRDIGWEYGHDAARRHLSLADTAQAMLFFRDTLVRAASPGPPSLQDAEDARIRRSLHSFLDAVFCAAMEAYEQTLRDHITSKSST